MPTEYPPNLVAIPDQPMETYNVKQTLKWLAERVGQLQDAQAAAAAAPSTQLADLERRLSALELRFNSLDSSIPSLSYGAWRQTSSIVGAGSYTWHVEDHNVGGWSRQATNTQIRIPFSGLVCVIAELLVSNMVADVNTELYLGSSAVQRRYVQFTAAGFGSGGLAAIVPASTGDFLELKNTAADRYGDANRYTTLFVFRVS